MLHTSLLNVIDGAVRFDKRLLVGRATDTALLRQNGKLLQSRPFFSSDSSRHRHTTPIDILGDLDSRDVPALFR